MKIGIIGLGTMGEAIAYRLLQAKFSVFGFDTNATICAHAQKLEVSITASAVELATQVDVVWLMLPAGNIIDLVIAQIMHELSPNTIVVDGGNSHFSDTVRRAHMLNRHGIRLLDCGTSGGLQGRELGFSLMIGGDHASFCKIEPLFAALAMPQGYAYMGPSGAGHYVKMIHNGIEYALLEAYGEGFQMLKEGRYPDLDMAAIACTWSNGSIIRSNILNLVQKIVEKDPNLQDIEGNIAEFGTGKWTVDEARDLDIPVPCIEKALQIRAWSRKTGGNYATKLVAMMRHQFGGHAVKKKEDIL